MFGIYKGGTLPAITLAAALAATIAAPGTAQSMPVLTVTSTQPTALTSVPNSTPGWLLPGEGFGAKYRISAGNWDMALGNRSDTAAPANYLSQNLGNVAGLSGDLFNFTLTYDPTTGYVFTLKNTTTNDVFSEVWGTGSGTGTTVSAATLNGVAPNANGYNALEIEARGQLNPSSLVVDNLKFTGGTLQGSALMDGTVGRNSTGTAIGDIAPAPSDRAYQYLISDTDMSTFAWSLMGDITATRTGSGDGEAVRFAIVGKNVGVNAVPVPAALPIIAAALAGFGFAGWRSKRRTA